MPPTQPATAASNPTATRGSRAWPVVRTGVIWVSQAPSGQQSVKGGGRGGGGYVLTGGSCVTRASLAAYGHLAGTAPVGGIRAGWTAVGLRREGRRRKLCL
jgi:hypothetical protein